MAREIDRPAAPAIDLAGAVALLDAAPPDWTRDDALDAATRALAGLDANRALLVDRAIDALKLGCREDRALDRYGAQVFMLHRAPGRYFIRANFWPAADDPVVQASGAAHFFYHVPHDHNFDFLTVGHIGPGYRSRWYRRVPGAMAGYDGEAAGLVADEEGQLSPGRMLHYRAETDVHDQLPPDAMSVSLNIVAERPGAMWRDQYLFDLDANRVSGCPTLSPAEIVLRLACAIDGNGADIAQDFARHHPSHRVRWQAVRAMAAAQHCAAARAALYETAAGDVSPRVAGQAAAMLEQMQRTGA